MNIKEQLYIQCQEVLNSRLKIIQDTIKDIQNSLQSETKSSAGDKHETGRAMLQLEREKAGNQLAEIEKTKQILSKIDIDKTNAFIGVGSVIYTNKSNYFIAISAGEIKIDNDTFYAISAHTPIGQLLMGETIGDVVKFREQEFKILAVL